MDIISRALDFLAELPVGAHRNELRSLVDKAAGGDGLARAELDDAFGATLSFGTAGLRGALGPGTNRMNRVTVARAAHGVARAVVETFGSDGKSRGVVIGYDARRLSRQFAEDSAAILVGHGVAVRVFSTVQSTPLTAFAVTHENAVAGIMVTASHNPPADNGFKVYWDNGAQIVPPIDGLISSYIEASPVFSELRRPNVYEQVAGGLRKTIGDEVTRAYLDAVAKHTPPPAPKTSSSRKLRIVYTPMHGVGHALTERAFREAGFHDVVVVPNQTEPDGAFPTVAFPNPEEPGALDEAIALANDVDADVIIAQDPDADRLAVAVRHPDDGEFRRLSGNDVGAILGADAIARARARGVKKPLVATTLVSSSMLSHMAKQEGVAYAETLTGFKWIANAALARLVSDDETFIFGFEEALGYSLGDIVRDKDGVHAAVRLADLCDGLREKNVSLHAYLRSLRDRYGFFESDQWSVVHKGQNGLVTINALMKKFRETSLTTLANEVVQEKRDLNVEGDPRFPRADVLVYRTINGTRLTVRPSGTEPKIKFYLEGRAHTGAEVDGLKRTLSAIRLQVEAFSAAV